jgi:hypothetical protein
MSAVLGGVGPVSVRYAAQIKQLLFSQAEQRLVAEQKAARAPPEIDKAARVEEPVKTDAETKAAKTAPPAAPVSVEPPAETPPPATFVNIQA